MLTRDVAPGVHLPAHACVNLYLLEGDDGITIVDTAFPATWPHLLHALRSFAALEETDARVVLPGHGAPWTNGIGPPPPAR